MAHSANMTYANPPQPPVLFDRDPASIIEEAQQLTERTKQVVDSIVASVTRVTADFANTIAPFAADENRRLTRDLFIGILPAQHEDVEVRNAASKARKIITEGRLAMLVRHDYSVLVRAVWEKYQSDNDSAREYGSQDELSGVDLCYLRKLYERFEEHGSFLDDTAAREKIHEFKQRMAEVSRNANANLSNDTSGLWLNTSELIGVPQDLLGRMKQRVHEDQEQYFVTMKDPDVNAVMQFASREDVRRQVHLFSANRLPQNVALYREMFLLRDETARLLGYPNHATMKTSSQMVHRSEVVNDFLCELERQTKPEHEEEVQVLKDLKSRDNDGQEVILYAWDGLYYETKRRQEAASIDESAIAEYFPLDNVLRSMFTIFGTSFGVHFETMIPQKNQIWHDSIKMFSVWRTDSNGFLGYLYCDLFPREGKFSHFSHYGLDRGYLDEAGNRHYPSSVMVTNITPPTSTKPSLLKYQYVSRLATQFGHVLHNMLSETKYAALHGLQTDKLFLKVQTKLFQHLFWTRDNVINTSCHYSYLSSDYYEAWRDGRDEVSQPPQKLPREMVQGAIDLEQGGSRGLQGELFRSMYDMQVHSPASREELERTDFAKMFNDLRRKLTGLAGSREYDGTESNGFATFKLIIGSFDVGYYVHLM